MTSFIWETIGITVLPPGWRNVYEVDGQPDDSDPCPVLLLQEEREFFDTGKWRVPVRDPGCPRNLYRRANSRRRRR